ncbi:hypothetical protein SDC9_176773 [bioreactor metagenome]|uniref:Uncharacterized protein n=1 Tax=bioreactor metagenome TaxID=1076179 RepID=A0A645GQZ1_9ZZZZ
MPVNYRVEIAEIRAACLFHEYCSDCGIRLFVVAIQVIAVVVRLDERIRYGRIRYQYPTENVAVHLAQSREVHVSQHFGVGVDIRGGLGIRLGCFRCGIIGSRRLLSTLDHCKIRQPRELFGLRVCLRALAVLDVFVYYHSGAANEDRRKNDCNDYSHLFFHDLAPLR